LVLVMWNVPVANEFFWGVVSDINHALNIDPRLAAIGRQQFQFWR